MKRILLLTLVVMLCITLCSCDTILKKAKSMVTGEEEPEMPEDYIATLENDEYSYELYDDYVKIIKYLVKDGDSAVTIPSEIDGKPVTVIGSLCFHDVETDVVTVNIPSSVITIEESAFYYADKLTSITIPDTVTSLGSRAFAWCNSLETVSFGKGISEIPEYCFNHCASLVTVAIPETITKIGVRAFSYCEKLFEITAPKTVTEIGERAFTGCPSLEYVTFENSALVLGNKLFENSEKIIVISPEGSSGKQYCERNGLRWSTSKDIEAVQLGNVDTSDASNESSTDSTSVIED